MHHKPSNKIVATDILLCTKAVYSRSSSKFLWNLTIDIN